MLTKTDIMFLDDRLDLKLNRIFDKKLKPIHDDIKTVKTDVGTLKQNVSVLQKDMTIVKNDVKKLQKDVTVVQKDVKYLKKELSFQSNILDKENLKTVKRVQIIETVLKIPTPDFV